MNKRLILFLIIFTMLCGLIGGFFAVKGTAPKEKHFSISARKYAYTPGKIRVNKGDTLVIDLKSEDVTHGFYLEGYDIAAKIRPQYPHFWLRHPSKGEEYEEAKEIRFTADKRGKFRYRCSITCGYFHPFMQGELIVSPNYVFPVSIGLCLGLTLSTLVYFRRRKE